MSLIGELNHIKASLKACRELITTLIYRWNNGEIDTSSDSDDNDDNERTTVNSDESSPIPLVRLCLDCDSDDDGLLEDIPRVPGVYKKPE